MLSKAEKNEAQNDRGNCFAEFRDFSAKNPEMTFGEMMYAILGIMQTEKGSKSMETIINTTNKEMYKIISKANEREKE